MLKCVLYNLLKTYSIYYFKHGTKNLSVNKIIINSLINSQFRNVKIVFSLKLYRVYEIDNLCYYLSLKIKYNYFIN